MTADPTVPRPAGFRDELAHAIEDAMGLVPAVPAMPLLARCDAIEFLRAIPSGSVHLAITDPAYESLEKHRAIGTTTRLKVSKSSSNAWFDILPNARFPELFAEIYRVLSKNAHFYLFCDQETMFVAKPLAEAAGFRFWKPIVWDKLAIGMGYHYRARYEFILFFEKGKRKLQNLGIPDVLRIPEVVDAEVLSEVAVLEMPARATTMEHARDPHEGCDRCDLLNDAAAIVAGRATGPDIIQSKRILRGYPTEKPPDVSRVLIQQSSSPGELVIDPFFGSGSTGVAALEENRLFIGSDLAESAVDHAAARLVHLRPTVRKWSWSP